MPEVEEAALNQPVFKSHAIAMHGQPKYGPGFEHFDYVNPNSPKGGELRFAVRGAYDSFNPYIPKGNAASGIGHVYETLLTSSADEPFTAADAVSVGAAGCSGAYGIGAYINCSGYDYTTVYNQKI